MEAGYSPPCRRDRLMVRPHRGQCAAMPVATESAGWPHEQSRLCSFIGIAAAPFAALWLLLVMVGRSPGAYAQREDRVRVVDTLRPRVLTTIGAPTAASSSSTRDRL